jgi:hypothetical protein
MTKPLQSIHATRVPSNHTASYRASEHIYERGPTLAADLFAAGYFGAKKFNRNATLERAIASGWLIECDDKIDISPFARKHFDQIERPETPKQKGEIAAKREYNAYLQPPLSKRYLTSSRGTRDDAPTWSHRGSDHHFFTQA